MLPHDVWTATEGERLEEEPYCFPAVLVRDVSPERGTGHHTDEHHLWADRPSLLAARSEKKQQLDSLSLSLLSLIHTQSHTQHCRADKPVAETAPFSF